MDESEPSAEGLEYPPRYFPLGAAPPEPLHAMAGRFWSLSRDAEVHGPLGGRHFQLDRALPRYLAEKRRVLAARTMPLRTTGAGVPIDVAARFVSETLAAEYPERFAGGNAPGLDALVAGVQEDLVVIAGPRGGDPAETRAVYVHVCFPSGWAPEAILGQGFEGIHAPVPSVAGLGFETGARGAAPSPRRQLAATLFGPAGARVRFVQSVTSAPSLDRHRLHGAGNDWPAAGEAFLRVERQVVVPLSHDDWAVSLFLIRVHVYSVASLDDGQRALLARWVASMPEALARYKDLWVHRDRVVALIEGAGPLADGASVREDAGP